jgi:hypothetical protein
MSIFASESRCATNLSLYRRIFLARPSKSEAVIPRLAEKSSELANRLELNSPQPQVTSEARQWNVKGELGLGSGTRQSAEGRPLSSTAAPEALAGGWRAQPERDYNKGRAGPFQWSIGSPKGRINVMATAASARLGTPNARLAERPYRYGRFILLRVMRRTQSSAAAIWAGVACGLITGVCAPSSHSCGHTLRFLARTP